MCNVDENFGKLVNDQASGEANNNHFMDKFLCNILLIYHYP